MICRRLKKRKNSKKWTRLDDLVNETETSFINGSRIEEVNEKIISPKLEPIVSFNLKKV